MPSRQPRQPRIATSSIEESLLGGLDEWIFSARFRQLKSRADQLIAIADTADKDPWRSACALRSDEPTRKS